MRKACINITGKQIAKMVSNGTAHTDNVIQRSYVWEIKRRTDFIHSLIVGYPVPPFYARKVEGGYDFLDGKQRLTTIAGFINNEWVMDGCPEITFTEDDGTETTTSLDGVYFKDLPESVQDEIKDYSFSIYYFDDISDYEVREMFRKLNNGKPLSAKEKVIASCVDITEIAKLGEHEVFDKLLTASGKEKRQFVPMLMKMWAMLNKPVDAVSFEAKDFNKLVSETETTEAERAEISAVLDKILNVYNVLTDRKCGKNVMRFKAETHLISLVPFFKRAIENEISDDLVADFIQEYYGEQIAVSGLYYDASQSGSAKAVNIQKRNEALGAAWEKFFAVE